MKPDILKTVIPLVAGGVAIYLVLKAREAKAAVPYPPTEVVPTFAVPEIKIPEAAKYQFDLKEGTASIRVDDWRFAVPIPNWLMRMMPLDHIKYQALPYYTSGAYAK